MFTDRTSNYFGSSAVNPSLLFSQGILAHPDYQDLCPDVVIHIGEISGDYPTLRQLQGKCEVWRVNKDGELRDLLWGLTTVFEMPEKAFFGHYCGAAMPRQFFEKWNAVDAAIRKNLPDVQFSNLWIAYQLSGRLPPSSQIHFGILNCLRSWNMFKSEGIISFCNVGGFGIDGCVSSLIGASLINRKKPYFGVFGDLAFFYDLNSMGSRHIGNNLRILVVNNGMGVEFANPGSIGDRIGDGVIDYISAGRHFGRQSHDLLRHMAVDLGFRYLSASGKDEFNSVRDEFLSMESEKPILLECFVDPADDASALTAYRNIDNYVPPRTIRSTLGRMLPSNIKSVIRRVGL